MPDAVDSDLKARVLLACFDALERHGFLRYKRQGVDLHLRDSFYCWVGINTAIEADYVEVNPSVGIHVVSIEKLWTSLTKGKYPWKYRRGVATYALHMGELAPKVPAFHFAPETDIASEAARLADLYCKVGVPYAKSISDYERTLPLLESRIDWLGAYPERVACCLYLMHRAADARAFVQDFLSREEDYFKGFAEPFLEMLSRD